MDRTIYCSPYCDYLDCDNCEVKILEMEEKGQMRINLDESVSNIVGELSKWERSFKTESGHEYRGDIFYSDIYSRVKRVTKNTNQGDYIYHGVCEKLRELGFWVHS